MRHLGATALKFARPVALQLALIAMVPLSAAQSSAQVEYQTIIVPATVNGTRREAMQVRIAGEDVWVAVADLEAAGLLPGVVAPHALRTSGGVDYLVLSDATQVLTWHLDPVQLALEIDLLPHAMATNQIGLSQRGAGTLRPGLPARLSSAYVNYSLNETAGQRPALFAEAVVSMHGHAFQMLALHDAHGSRRGATSLTFNDEAAKRQVILGDSLSGTGGLLSGVPLGGVTWRSNFAYEPWALTSPTLGLRGYAPTPSTVDVLVNGTRVAQRQIPAGPFELRDILPAGGGTQVSAVVRDAFGRETRFAGDSFYASPLLLRQGLSAWTVSAGRLREDLAEASPRYGDAVVAAQASHGWLRDLTAGASAQLTTQRQVAGVHAVTTGAWGEAAVQLAASRATGDAGARGVAGSSAWRHANDDFGVGLNLLWQSRGFEALASPADRPLRAVELSAGRRQFGIDWSARLSSARSASDAASQALSVTASRRLGNSTSLVAGASVGRGASPTGSVWLLLSWMLDASHTVSASITRDRSGDGGRSVSSVEAVQAPQEALSTGWRVSAAQPAGGPGWQSAQVRRDTAFGDYEISAARHDGAATQASWRASGALLWAGGGLAAAAPIRDAFAVVRVAGLPHIPVRVEGRVAGVTDGDGQLVLPRVTSYAQQRVSLDANELPEGHEIAVTEQRMNPPQRGGEILDFEPRLYRAAVGRLLDAGAQPLRGATLVLADGRRTVTGTGGDFAVEGELAGGEARAEFAVPGGFSPGVAARPGCVVHIPQANATEAIRRLGDIQCAP